MFRNFEIATKTQSHGHVETQNLVSVQVRVSLTLTRITNTEKVPNAYFKLYFTGSVTVTLLVTAHFCTVSHVTLLFCSLFLSCFRESHKEVGTFCG